MKSLLQIFKEDMGIPPSIDIDQGDLNNEIMTIIKRYNLELEDIIFRLNTSKNALAFMGSHINKYFDRGRFGLIFLLDDGKLLKLSEDFEEAKTSHQLKNLGGSIAEIYDVAEFKFREKGFSLFLILMEKIEGVELWKYYDKIRPAVYFRTLDRFIINPAKKRWYRDGFPPQITASIIVSEARKEWERSRGGYSESIDNVLKEFVNSNAEAKQVAVKVLIILKNLYSKGIQWEDSHFGNFIINTNTKEIKAIDMGISSGSSEGSERGIKKLAECSQQL